MTGRGGQLEQISWADLLGLGPRSGSTAAESCVSGAPAAGGICLEHGESACVLTLPAAG
ncbi:MAG: hypothetical protein HYU55_00375 [Nocardioides sp.]|nr:hypothetical protein [Nocardioides sp.]